jgi:hypothetical protein
LPAGIKIDLVAARRAEAHCAKHPVGGGIHSRDADAKKDDQAETQNTAHRRAKLRIRLPPMLKAVNEMVEWILIIHVRALASTA